jgi:hypothetical protein
MPVARRGSRAMASEMFCCWLRTYSSSLFCNKFRRLNITHPRLIVRIKAYKYQAQKLKKCIYTANTIYTSKYAIAKQQVWLSIMYLGYERQRVMSHTFILLFTSSNLSAMRESNSGKEISAKSVLTFRLFLNKSTLPAQSPPMH